jgi:hypothetical protein
MTAHAPYPGRELEIFDRAANWKRYWSEMLRPYVAGAVIEVGAGIGSNTRLLWTDRVAHWTSLEPDPRLAEILRARRAAGQVPKECEIVEGTLEETPRSPLASTIIYIDVVEHIADDRAEAARAIARLKPGGHVLVLAPAHGWLFSAFDAAIGHHRRYTRADLSALFSPDLEAVKIRYLDSVGIAATLANRLLLRETTPGAAQIACWDRVMVPMSRRLDPVLGYRLGKSVLGVWRKPA